MGTEKYPDEAQYRQYLGDHNGQSNAFTSGEHTNYYFGVEWRALEGAMDRMAQFFIAPLFEPSVLGREMQVQQLSCSADLTDSFN